MPKSKVRKKTAYTPPSDLLTTAASRAKARTPSPTWYAALMIGLMLVGLVYIVLFYITGDRISFMSALGSWNFLVGFALMVGGLVMSMRWR